MRQSVDRHLEHCIACREEYRLWEESERLIRGLADEQESAVAVLAEGVNRNVMDRIYAEEGWLLSHRTPFQPLTRHFDLSVLSGRSRVSGYVHNEPAVRPLEP